MYHVEVMRVETVAIYAQAKNIVVSIARYQNWELINKCMMKILKWMEKSD